MFEIGNSLREARLRQGLDLAEIEQATKIRSRYLRALEEEQFELLPAHTYVKGFLKAYADELGLDGELYVEEYNSRFAAGDEEQPLPRGRGSGGSWPGPMRLQSSAVLISLTAIGLATALVVLAWRFGATGEQSVPGLPPAASETTTNTSTKTRQERPRSSVAARRVRLVAVAARGDCWLEIHRGSEAGDLLFQGTLEHGDETAPFSGKRLWLAIGAPSNVVIKVNGNRVRLPASRIVVSRKGVFPSRT